MKRITSFLMMLLLLTMTIWFIGFIWFIGEVPRQSLKKTSNDKNKSDIGIVLTGAKGRIEHGLIMLHEKRVPKLFISGVNEHITNEQLFSTDENKLKNKLYNKYKNKIIIGRTARSTRGNALEVKKHLENNTEVKSAMIITTNYHIPRGMHEFNNAINNIEIIAEPVFSPQFSANWWESTSSVKLLISEYHKFIISYSMKFIAQETHISELIANNPL